MGKYDYDVTSHIWYTNIGKRNISVVIFENGIVEVNNHSQLPFVQLDIDDLKEIIEKQEKFKKARIFHKRAMGE